MMTTTMDQDKGLSRRLPPMPDPNHKLEDQKVNKRNIVVVKILLTILVIGGLVAGAYALAPGDMIQSETLTPDQISTGDLKMTDTVLYLAYLMFGATLVALVTSWVVGAVRK